MCEIFRMYLGCMYSVFVAFLLSARLSFVTFVSFPIAAEAAIDVQQQNYLKEVFNPVSQQPCYWSTTASSKAATVVTFFLLKT